ncbi:prepilin-type N-terminal cleavage/methylation domain-containing protein [Aromatoleum toluvorans]|uniref:Type II secretion system protein H n=1 Tax=Aromatoleum toluvorans TaxID=92002 RepID=A0ABX1Q4T8_9RHOO|nr:GspH/FimT family pseudopilin [Aromatoleum toluvorans]NMG45792.1 prepilin-type N-terminal cleavage/methylation domain-containing protein [Aromatoleum toluvorans]
MTLEFLPRLLRSEAIVVKNSRGWSNLIPCQVHRVACIAERGYSLVELMIVLAIVGVISAIAAPSFARLLAETRVGDASSDLFAAVLQTRSEAMKRHQRVVLCVSPDGADCGSEGGWEQGWIVFEDGNENGRREAEEPLMRAGEVRAGRVGISGDGSVGRYVSYVASGRTQQLTTGAWQAGTLTICSEGIARKIIINRVGRPRIAKGNC